MIALVYFGLIVVAFFVLIVLPQRRRVAAHRVLVQSLVTGDEVITAGGIHGTIRSLDEQTLRLEVADGVVIRVARGAIAQRLVPPDAEAADEPGGEAIDGSAS